MSKTPLRSIRVDDELWAEAQEVAEAYGDTMTSIVRDTLRAYIASHPLKKS